MSIPEQDYLQSLQHRNAPPTVMTDFHEGLLERQGNVDNVRLINTPDTAWNRTARVREGHKLLAMAGLMGPGSETAVVPAPSAFMAHTIVPANEIDVVDLRRLMAAKELRHQDTFKIVLERCYRIVRRTAAAKRYACMFEVPEFVHGRPMYDLLKCIEYIVRSITSNGYAVQYVYPRLLLISWQVVQSKQHDAVVRNIYRMQQKSIESALQCQQKEEQQMLQREQDDVADIPNPDVLHANLMKANNVMQSTPIQQLKQHANIIDTQNNSGFEAYPNNPHNQAQYTTQSMPEHLQPAHAKNDILPPPVSTRMFAAAQQYQQFDQQFEQQQQQQQQQRQQRRNQNQSTFRSIAEFKPSGKLMLNV